MASLKPVAVSGEYEDTACPTAEIISFIGDEASDLMVCLVRMGETYDAPSMAHNLRIHCGHNWQEETYYTGDCEAGEQEVAHTGRYCTLCNLIQREGEF